MGDAIEHDLRHRALAGVGLGSRLVVDRQRQALLGASPVGQGADELQRMRSGAGLKQAGGRVRKGKFRIVRRPWICRATQVRQVVQVIERGAREAGALDLYLYLYETALNPGSLGSGRSRDYRGMGVLLQPRPRSSRASTA